MKNYLILCAVGLASCSGNGTRNSEGLKQIDEDTVHTRVNSKQEQQRRYCFIRTEGTDQQDTTTVRFTLNADIVEGEMQWIPQEKDSRKGVLAGTISGDEITAIWRYRQEGIKDSMRVAFKLSSVQLAQKPLKVNNITGSQETDDTADYTLLYTSVNCGD